MDTREAIARARELGAEDAAEPWAESLGTPAFPLVIALECFLRGEATVEELERFIVLLTRRPSSS